MGINNLAFFTQRSGAKMKTRKIILTFLLLSLFILFSVFTVSAQTENPPDINEDKVVIGQTFTLKENQDLNGELAIIGGTVTLEQGSTINGDVAVIGGAIEVAGTVNGDIQGLGGSIALLSTARINGSIYNYSTNLSQEEGAVIEGQQISSLPFNLDFGDISSPNINIDPQISNIRNGLGFIGKLLWATLQIIALGAFAMVVVLIAPKPTDRVARSIEKLPFVHWGIGLLTSFAAPAVILVLAITIILIPLGIIGILIYSFAIFFGWLALGYTIGKRLFEKSTHNYSPALIAGIGTIILSAVARFGAEIPCIGWMIGGVLSLFGLGAVVMTRFGTRDYPFYEAKSSSISYAATPKTQKVEQTGSILANIKSDIEDDLEADEFAPDTDQFDDGWENENDENGEKK
jgi:hypothetical protein